MLTRLAAFFICISFLTATPAPAQPSRLGGLEPGPHAVGFRLTTIEDATRLTGGRAPVEARAANRARTLRVHVWYPAAAAGTPLTIGDYLQIAGPAAATHRQDMPRTVALTLDDAEWAAYTGFQMAAARPCGDRKSTRLNSSHS